MPAPSVFSHFNAFRDKTTQLTDFANRSTDFLENRGNQARSLLTRDRYLLVEVCFLQVLMAWETFLEEAFARFMCGARRLSVPRDPVRLTQFPSLQDAKLTIYQGRRYANWLVPANIEAVCLQHFDQGAPFLGLITAANLELNEIRIIRNKIAHSSSHATREFRNLMIRKLPNVHRGVSPGRFLLSPVPQTMNPQNLGNFYQFYASFLETLAQLIIG